MFYMIYWVSFRSSCKKSYILKNEMILKSVHTHNYCLDLRWKRPRDVRTKIPWWNMKLYCNVQQFQIKFSNTRSDFGTK